jgi:hypothetical protein
MMRAAPRIVAQTNRLAQEMPIPLFTTRKQILHVYFYSSPHTPDGKAIGVLLFPTQGLVPSQSAVLIGGKPAF